MNSAYNVISLTQGQLTGEQTRNKMICWNKMKNYYEEINVDTILDLQYKYEFRGREM